VRNRGKEQEEPLLDAWEELAQSAQSARKSRLLRAGMRDLSVLGPRATLEKAAGLLRARVQAALPRWTPRRLWLPLSSIPIDRPIFILGVQGGGITVLARCLYRHPDVVYASGSSSFWAGEDEIHNARHIRGLPEPMVHRSLHFGNVEGRLADHPRFGLQRAWLYAVDELLPHHARGAEDATESDRTQLRNVMRSLIRAYAHVPRRARFVDMSQLYTLQVPYICKLLEGCDPHFVLAVRNPYVTCARAALKEYEPERGSHIREAGEKIRLAVEHWVNSYRAALENEGRVPMRVVRYEDFMDDPAAVVRGICNFADLRYSDALVPGPGQKIPLGSVSPDKWYPLKPAENDRYLADIDPRVVEFLDERGADLIARFDYPRP